MKKYESLILAAVVIGAFPLSYIITTLYITIVNKRKGYPVYLKGNAIPLICQQLP